MKIPARVLFPRMLLTRDLPVETTENGLVLPNAARRPPNTGVVAACDTGHEDNRFKVGDRVMFAEYAAVEVSLGGQPYLLLRQEDIMLIFTENGA